MNQNLAISDDAGSRTMAQSLALVRANSAQRLAATFLLGHSMVDVVVKVAYFLADPAANVFINDKFVENCRNLLLVLMVHFCSTTNSKIMAYSRVCYGLDGGIANCALDVSEANGGFPPMENTIQVKLAIPPPIPDVH